jgi:hypothetical protein
VGVGPHHFSPSDKVSLKNFGKKIEFSGNFDFLKERRKIRQNPKMRNII